MQRRQRKPERLASQRKSSRSRKTPLLKRININVIHSAEHFQKPVRLLTYNYKLQLRPHYRSIMDSGKRLAVIFSVLAQFLLASSLFAQDKTQTAPPAKVQSKTEALLRPADTRL